MRDVQQGLIKQKRKPDQDPPQVPGGALAVVLGLTCTGSTSGRRLRFSIPGHLALSVQLGDAGRVQAQTMMATSSMASGRKASAFKYQRGRPLGTWLKLCGQMALLGRFHS